MGVGYPVHNRVHAGSRLCLPPTGVYIIVMDMETLKAEFLKQQRGFQIANELRVRELKARTHEEWLHGLSGLFMVKEPAGSLFHDAADLQKVLVEHDVSFCFIGGVALQKWGEVRQTTDVDVNIHCELGNEDQVRTVLQKTLTYRDEESREVFSTNRVFFGRTVNGYDVDIFVGFTPYERRMTERAVMQDYGLEDPLQICSAEDLVITKTLAGRGQDWVDIQRIIQRSGETMEWPLIYRELKPLLALYNEAERLSRLRKMVAEEYK